MARMDWEGARRREMPAGPRAMPARQPGPTAKQRAFVKRLGGTLDRNATRADAAAVIDALLRKRRASRRNRKRPLTAQEAWQRRVEQRLGAPHPSGQNRNRP